jgi:DNA repair exonuclease SbcCD ATPase subunit
MSDIVVMRDIEIITTEIKTIEAQVAKAAIYGFIEIGKLLMEAKEMVGHGGWGKYLEEKVRYSQQWATNLMNLYREYGSAQESLFENFANSQSFGKIDVTKHILLLGVPAEKRQAFAEEHDAENLTVKQLQAAIRERDAATERMNEEIARADKAREKAANLQNQLEITGDQLTAQKAKVKELQEQAEAAAKNEADATAKVDKLKQQLAKAKEGEKTAKDALQKAKEHPEIPETMMEEMRQQVAADAAQQATAEIKKQLEAAQIAAAEAESRREEAEGRLAEAEKKAKAADGNIALVKAYSEGVVDQFNKMLGAIKLVEQADPERGANLRKNAREKVLPALMKALEG